MFWLAIFLFFAIPAIIGSMLGTTTETTVDSNLTEAETSYMEEPQPIESAGADESLTKDGYLATISEESFDLLINAVNNKEYALIENMLISGVAIQLKDGVRVVDLQCGGTICSRLTFRFPDNPTIYYTVNEAITRRK
ncbi:hypothetical protein NON20_07450 [Synechocystis sp. B12]|nr:hypothetical protein NON20_07450 [Synechocystis sp. B12]